MGCSIMNTVIIRATFLEKTNDNFVYGNFISCISKGEIIRKGCVFCVGHGTGYLKKQKTNSLEICWKQNLFDFFSLFLFSRIKNDTVFSKKKKERKKFGIFGFFHCKLKAVGLWKAPKTWSFCCSGYQWSRF